jgi:hypothetical protein
MGVKAHVSRYLRVKVKNFKVVIPDAAKNGMGEGVLGSMGEILRHSGNHDLIVIIRNPEWRFEIILVEV